jgi:hypothetical protein
MSTRLAIAAVTAVLKDLLQNGIIDRGLTSGIGNVPVSALPPDRIPSAPAQDSRLNLYMYCVTPNQGWNNYDMPAFNGNGNRLTNPPLALDLHYLLTAYGNEEFHAEIMLGFAMQLLHENPILPRSAIQRAFTPQINVAASASELPPIMRVLQASDLADQLETVKITPRTLDSEEISRLWGAFQMPYRPTAAYQVSVVLIESSKPVKPSLPVLTSQLAAISLRHPEVSQVRAIGQALITPGAKIEISGTGFSGDLPIVQVDGDDITPVTRLGDRTLRTTLPAGLNAGIHGIQVIHPVRFGASTRLGERSNLATFVLHPMINKNGAGVYDITVANVAGQPGARQITIKLNPNVTPDQQALIELVRADGSLLIFGESALAAPDTLVFTVAGVAAGDYFVRVRIAGADSPMELDANGQIVAPKKSLP